ncbi:hypothetical protein [Roseibacillus persicicus]|uniref:DUF4198 domain-containing protein n=1 Tax=Roseibacillus persicicus TaxID=454148 RepID=A0A918TF68_9BACT|nr:hypothetical protein [Roseibacillus persicicus]MDQ8189212.1 hypothetical protein [Roseibacillus persicicus]GHC44113.1 hypothetical protein GCM10007100_06680 [Roseibacillus persicicus]
MKFNVALPAFLALFAASLLPLSAQGEAKVAMTVDLVAWGDTIEGLSLKTEGKGETLTALPFTYSTPARYTGPALMEVHQKGGSNSSGNDEEISAEDAEHESKPLVVEQKPEDLEDLSKSKDPIVRELFRRRETEPSLVALVKLPTNTKRATVLLAPAGGGLYQPYVINDDPSKLPPGKLRVHNLSPFDISMRFSGKQKADLKPGRDSVINAANGRAVYELSYKGPKGWEIQENNVIPVRPTEQTQLIVLKSDNSYFLSSDGAAGGFMQIVILRRSAS